VLHKKVVKSLEVEIHSAVSVRTAARYYIKGKAAFQAYASNIRILWNEVSYNLILKTAVAFQMT